MEHQTLHKDEKEAGVLTTTELRQFLTSLLDNPQRGICIRTRCIGEMWQPNFMRLLTMTDKGVVILNDEVQGKAVIVPYVRDIIQLEIDKPFERYEPHYHYTVRDE